MTLEPEEFIKKVKDVMQGYDVEIEYTETSRDKNQLSGFKTNGGIPCTKSGESFAFDCPNGSKDLITIGIEALAINQGNVTKQANDNGEKIYGVVIYSDLMDVFNKYATVQFDLEHEQVSRLKLYSNGRSMIPEVEKLQGKKLDKAVESLFEIIFTHRGIPKKGQTLFRKSHHPQPVFYPNS